MDRLALAEKLGAIALDDTEGDGSRAPSAPAPLLVQRIGRIEFAMT